MKDPGPHLTTRDRLPRCFPLWRHDHKHINKSYSVINNRCRIKSVDKLHQVSGLYAFSTTSKSHCSRKLPKQLFSLKSCSLGKHPLSFHALTGEIDTDSLETALGIKIHFTMPTTCHRIAPNFEMGIFSPYTPTERNSLKNKVSETKSVI